MILEYIRYRVPAERGVDFAAAYATASAVLDADEHCLGYEVARGVEEHPPSEAAASQVGVNQTLGRPHQ